MIPKKWRSLWRSVADRSKVEEQISDELQLHIEARADDLQRRNGVSRGEAIRQARVEFGSVEKYREEIRESVGLRLLDQLRADVRQAFRVLVRNPGFSLAAIITLAIGIGANTSVFSVIDAVVIKDLPGVRAPADLVALDWIWTRDAMIAEYNGSGRPGPTPQTNIRTSFSALTFERIRERNHTLSSVFAFGNAGPMNVFADGEAGTAAVQFVSGEYFTGLGVEALKGRTINPADDDQATSAVAVLSYRYWQSRFHGDPGILGKTVEINRHRFAVIGVAPENFIGMRVAESLDVMLPLASVPLFDQQAGRGHSPSLWWVQIMGRRKPGFTLENIHADLQPAFESSVRESWDSRTEELADASLRRAIPQFRVRAGGQGPIGPPLEAARILSLSFAVVGAVLLIGCVNLANLLLARASTRRREISVRLALGAGRFRIVRQLLTENLLLSICGGAAGVLFAIEGKNFVSFIDNDPINATIDSRVLAFALILSILTAIAFGVGPALRATARDWSSDTKVSTQKGAVTRSLLHRTLIGAQVAICLILLVGAGLFIRTVRNYSLVDVGFDPDNVLVFRINQDAGREQGRLVQVYEQILEKLQAIPGVRAATLSVMPVVGRAEWTESISTDPAAPPQEVYFQIVRWNFFEAMKIPLLRGRSFSEFDDEGRPRVAVVNETMAKQLFGESTNPLGRHFQFIQGPRRNIPIEVIGIARDSKYSRLDQVTPPTFFMAYTQAPVPGVVFEVRTIDTPALLLPRIREAVRSVDPQLPLTNVKTQRQQIAETIALPRVFAGLTSIFGIVGLILACLGLYGIVSYNVTARTNEIGVRMTLGAQRSNVIRLILRETAGVVLVGTAIGLAAAIAATRFIREFFFGISPYDPEAIVLATALLIGVAALAAYIPARRASRLDPAQALRYE